MTDSEDARLRLLDQSAAFRQLSADHHSLDDRLKRLATKIHLSDDEQLEEVRLKKEKLRLKDQMETLVRQFRASTRDSLPA